MSGLGDACTDLGPGFVTQPDGMCQAVIVGSGIPSSEPAITSVITATGPAPSSSPSWFDSLVKGFAAATGTPAAPVVAAPQTGISTTTMVVAGVGLVALALILSKK